MFFYEENPYRDYTDDEYADSGPFGKTKIP
jgi:hypothetical protein